MHRPTGEYSSRVVRSGGMLMGDDKSDGYTEEEARRRLEAALRGARLAEPKPMKDPPHTRHSAPARSQDCADEENACVPPGAVDEQRHERQDNRGEAGGQVRHQASLA